MAQLDLLRGPFLGPSQPVEVSASAGCPAVLAHGLSDWRCRKLACQHLRLVEERRMQACQWTALLIFASLYIRIWMFYPKGHSKQFPGSYSLLVVMSLGTGHST